MGRMKGAYLERVNKRKAKPSKICKVYKGAHIFKPTNDEPIGLYPENKEVYLNVVCKCGKKGMKKVTLESGELLDSFIDYCRKHHNERFWQALTNWSTFNYIYGSERDKSTDGLCDVFYKEEK